MSADDLIPFFCIVYIYYYDNGITYCIYTFCQKFEIITICKGF